MSIESGLLFTASHEWAKVEGDEALVGISAYAQDQLGDITFIELPDVGAMLEAGKEFGSVESVKAAGELYSPVSGEVIAVNDALTDAPEAVNQSPYDSGWMIRVRLSVQPANLMDADTYNASLTEK